MSSIKMMGRNKTGLKRIAVFTLFLLYIIIPIQCIADTGKNIYRFPDMYNPNPVAGRLYLQPIGVYEDQVVKGSLIDFAWEMSSDYNRYFIEEKGDTELTSNSYIYMLRLAQNLNLSQYQIEAGCIIRVHQDDSKTPLSSFLKNFHHWTDEHLGYDGHTPPSGQYHGAIGDNNTEVIGKSGEIYLTTVQLYTKWQLLKDSGVGTSTPNLSLKFSARIPASGKDFDTSGAAISLGASKKIFSQFLLTGAAGIIYQDLDENDFNATNLDISQCVYDLFIGFTWDFFKPNGFYVPMGLRYSTNRASYKDNSRSDDGAYVIHLGFNYKEKLTSGNTIELYFNCNEDIPEFGHSLEPDFRIQFGLSYEFGI